ncbi:MAG TPA: transposase [Opitutaceae bacterium]|nr:transposase [Opitutaceae bacterium]
MPRKLRVEYGGACYHVINRGNYRRDLFMGKGAAESFIGCLLEGAERFGWRVHAYVVMSNHFHLAVETPEPNLSDGWLDGPAGACRRASVNTSGAFGWRARPTPAVSKRRCQESTHDPVRVFPI